MSSNFESEEPSYRARRDSPESYERTDSPVDTETEKRYDRDNDEDSNREVSGGDRYKEEDLDRQQSFREASNTEELDLKCQVFVRGVTLRVVTNCRRDSVRPMIVEGR